LRALRGAVFIVAGLLCFGAGLATPLHAAQLFGKRTPDAVTATCTAEPAQIEYRASARVKARIEATDSKKHALAYVWSGNGGQIVGSGAAVEVDVSRLSPGSYRLTAAAQDAYRNRAECSADFQVMPPPEPLAARCTAEPAEVPAGETAHVRLEAAGAQGHTLRYSWFTNGGTLAPERAEASLQTKDLIPGDYSVTGRVDDELGRAADCQATVRVFAPPPPPPPPEIQNLAQIVFPRNSAQLGGPETQQLQKVLDRLNSDLKGTISVESYAGPDEKIPKELAAARAESIRYALAGQGVDPARIKIHVGLGGRLGGVRNRTTDIVWVPAGMVY
jgi:outer membrane protein OmpA-like peptidoglycan-associated protein